MMALDISISPELSGQLRLGVLVLEGVLVGQTDEALAAQIEKTCDELKVKYGGLKSADVPGTGDARSLYKALGLDPTKTRPSNEALLRRALKGEPLYRINTLVDALNLSSLQHQLPFGLYDLGKVSPPVLLRRGLKGENYEGIRKGAVNVEGRPTLVDREGAFGNPTSDSARTMITKATRTALVTAYAPKAYNVARLSDVMDKTEATLVRFCGGVRSDLRLLT